MPFLKDNANNRAEFASFSTVIIFKYSCKQFKQIVLCIIIMRSVEELCGVFFFHFFLNHKIINFVAGNKRLTTVFLFHIES